MKLTNSIRDDIQRALLTHVFKSRIEDLMARREAFITRVYKDVFSEEERNLMASLPCGWLRSDDDFKVVFGDSGSDYAFLCNNGTWHSSHTNLVSYTKPERIFRLFPYNSNPYKVYEKNHPLSQEYHAFESEIDDLNKDIQQKKDQARGTLQSCSTVNMLVKAWPEIRPFIPEHCFEKGSTAVALPVEQLNRSFNLPKEAA